MSETETRPSKNAVDSETRPSKSDLVYYNTGDRYVVCLVNGVQGPREQRTGVGLVCRQTGMVSRWVGSFRSEGLSGRLSLGTLPELMGLAAGIQGSRRSAFQGRDYFGGAEKKGA